MEKQPVPYQRILFVCTNERPPGERPCCAAKNSAAIRATLKEMVEERGLRGRVRVSQSGCLDRCGTGPNIMVFPDNVWYSSVTLDDVDSILNDLVASLEAE